MDIDLISAEVPSAEAAATILYLHQNLSPKDEDHGQSYNKPMQKDFLFGGSVVTSNHPQVLLMDYVDNLRMRRSYYGPLACNKTWRCEEVTMETPQ